ncbi:MAG: MlaD family protein, partial [Desulfobulbaceae bacterium]|nr:MlaD family protein [Desulfobulbaceae bacterium]
KIKNSFTITETTTLHHEQGLHLTLVAPRLAHLRPSSPIYYRQIQIGEVTDYRLAPTGQSVLIELHIEQEYAPIIHTGSKFWLTSGIQITGGLFSEFQVSAESMESLLKGGVGVATPDNNHDMGRIAQDGDSFVLYQEVDPKWLKWSPELPIRPVKTPSPNSNKPGDKNE